MWPSRGRLPSTVCVGLKLAKKLLLETQKAVFGSTTLERYMFLGSGVLGLFFFVLVFHSPSLKTW